MMYYYLIAVLIMILLNSVVGSVTQNAAVETVDYSTFMSSIENKTIDKVDISDDGTIKIASANADSIKKAYDMIYSIVAEPEEGKVYTGKVVKLVDFGAFVNFFGKRDGLVHVSQIANKRLNHPNELLKEGQEVKVKLLGFDDRGKVRLGMKMVDQETGEEIAPEKKEEAQAE